MTFLDFLAVDETVFIGWFCELRHKTKQLIALRYCYLITYCYNLPMYQVVYKEKALKTLKQLPKSVAYKFEAAFLGIASNNAENLDIKPMKSMRDFRLRVGAYRAIYRVLEDVLVVMVLKLGSRGDVYK